METPDPVASEDRVSRSTGILWGLTKCGKTTFLRSLPGRKLYLMIDPDGDETLPDAPDIKVMRLYEYDDDEVIHLLENKLPSYLKKHAGDYDSVITDSITSVARIALEEAIRKKIGSSERSGFEPTLDAPGQAAYGARTQHIIKVVNKILRATGSVGKHCWFTAHEDEPKTTPKGDPLYTTMALSGKSINGAGLNVSEIWHLRFNDKQQFISIAACRGRQPMGTRMFKSMGNAEFLLQFNPELGQDQPHSIATWFHKWQAGGRTKLSLPRPIKE